MRSRQSFLATLFLLVVAVLPTVAANCDKCGKKLAFGAGTCAACKLKVLDQAARDFDKKHHLNEHIDNAIAETKERVEKNVESAAKNGQVIRFIPKGRYTYNGDHNREALFINGMRTDFADWQRQVQQLANILGRPVTGVYAGGLTRGITTSMAIQIQNWTQEGTMDQLPEAQALIAQLNRVQRVSRDVDLICHSRGTMLTEAILRKQSDWAANHVTVYALGCAVSGSFPVRNYYKIVNRGDDLMKDRMVDQRQLVWGSSGGHDLEDYIANLENGNYDTDLPVMTGVTRK